MKDEQRAMIEELLGVAALFMSDDDEGFFQNDLVGTTASDRGAA